MSLSLEGIGAVLRMDDDYTVINSLVAGGPALKSKELAVGDKILAVGQAGKPMVDVVGWRRMMWYHKSKVPKAVKSAWKCWVIPKGPNHVL